jgi:hypothetical protein
MAENLEVTTNKRKTEKEQRDQGIKPIIAKHLSLTMAHTQTKAWRLSLTW